MPEAELTAALVRKGFETTRRRGGRTSLVRHGDDRHDHVLLRWGQPSWWRRLLRRPPTVAAAVAAVVWPVAEETFARPVPPDPRVPQQAHAATGFDALCTGEIDAATIAAAIDDCLRRLEDPGVALDLGAVTEPLRRLELAVVASRGELGRRAAETARGEARRLPPTPRREVMERIAVAEARLPDAPRG